jgi:hypothetical protein
MAGIIQWAIGRNTTVTVTPQDVSSTGVLSDNAFGSVSFTGRIEDVSDEIQVDTDTIAAMDGYVATPVVQGISGTIRITEIDQALPLVTSSNKGFGYGNALRVIGRTSFYAKIVIELWNNASTPVLIERQTIYGLLTQPRSSSRSRGKATTSGTFTLVDVFNETTGARIANPAFS